MINYDSILSAFDGKPTLLQWLKLVKKALDESVLKDITLKQDGANVIFTFNFEDGTSISTPSVTLPKGNTGAKGDKGEQGVSVTGVDEVSNEVVGTQTLTTLRFNFSNGTNNEVIVHVENGKPMPTKLYQMQIKFVVQQHSSVNIDFPTTRETITVDEVFELSGFFTGHISEPIPIPIYFVWELIDPSKPNTPNNIKINVYKISDNTLYATLTKDNYDSFYIYEL